jgi:ubiquinol-cytochrome c reductase cytochrome c1 subunit
MRIALGLGLSLAILSGAAATAQTISLPAIPPKNESFSFEGPFGHYDRASLQRGFQVYKEVCSACHSLNLVAFHSLDEEGGPGFTEPQAKAIAAAYKVPAEPNDKGDTFDANGNRLTRPGTIADHFPAPFANDNAARAANNGALPPDMSTLVKARAGGAAYVYSICSGFYTDDGKTKQTPPAGFTVLPNKYYNPYFEGRNISMPPPLTANQVTYSDGTKATLDQECHDIATFLSWTSEPRMEERKQMGFSVMIFLVLFSGLLYLSYRKIWRDAH